MVTCDAMSRAKLCARHGSTTGLARNGSSPRTGSRLPQPMSCSGRNAGIRPKATLGTAYEFATGRRLCFR